MRKFFIVSVSIVFLAIIAVPANAQPQPSMYTLDNIYYYLAEGTEASWGAHSLGPQSGVPGGDVPGFTKSLEDIYYYMYDSFSQCNATYDIIAPNLEEWCYFFCTETTYWGVRQGLMPDTRTWYEIYGPSGTGDVVQIGSMYVASSKDGTGCALNGTKNWATACSWGTGLSWLSQTDWHLPTKTELLTICSNEGSLASYQSGVYWSSTGIDAAGAWYVYFLNCYAYDANKANYYYVRAVRSSIE